MPDTVFTQIHRLTRFDGCEKPSSAESGLHSRTERKTKYRARKNRPGCPLPEIAQDGVQRPQTIEKRAALNQRRPAKPAMAAPNN